MKKTAREDKVSYLWFSSLSGESLESQRLDSRPVDEAKTTNDKGMQQTLLKKKGRRESSFDTKAMIYEYICAHPGIHVRKMSKELGLATGHMQYHLNVLEKQGMIESNRDGFFRFVYPSRIFGEKQEIILGALSQEIPREILLHLIRNNGLTQVEIAEKLHRTSATISWHMDRLVHLGVVSRVRKDRGFFYEVTADHTDILNFIKNYHPSVWGKWATRLGQMILPSLNVKGNKEEK